MKALIRRTILGWQAWRARKKLEQAIPELRQAHEQIARCKKAHTKGAKQAYALAFAATTARLQQEIGSL